MSNQISIQRFRSLDCVKCVISDCGESKSDIKHNKLMVHKVRDGLRHKHNKNNDSLVPMGV